MKILFKQYPLTLQRLDFFYALVFFYFFSLSAELWYVPLFIFKPKVTHIIALILLAVVFFRQKKMVLEQTLIAPFVWILASMVISMLLGTHLARSFGYLNVYLFNFICYFLLPFNLVRQFDQEKIFRLYFLSFICVGVYAASQILLSIFGIYDPIAVQRVGSFARGQAWCYEPSYYALYMMAFVMFFNARVVFRRDEKFSKMKLLGVNLLLLVSTSTSVFFAYPIFFAICLILAILPFIQPYVKNVKRRVLLFTVKCATIFGLMALFLSELFFHSFYKFFYLGFATHWSFRGRWESIVRCWNLFLEHPIFGVGVGGVGPYFYQDVYQAGNFPETLKELELFDPMNVFTEVLASLGICGLCGFCFLACRFYTIFKVANMNFELSQKERAEGIALFISLIVMMLVLQFNQGLFRPYIWAHAGMSFGYLCFHKER